MVLRGVASIGSQWSVRRRTFVVGALVAFLVASVLLVHLAERAGADGNRCDRFASDSRARAAVVSGSGEQVVVIGDSWSAGLGLDRIASSWPSRLPGTVHVAGFSGSGFSEAASPCRGVSFADRAPAAVRGGPDLVVVEGGLNDYDVPSDEIRAGFRRLMAELRGLRVVVVGPASAPSRALEVPRVDALLGRLSAAYGVDYVRTSGLELPYLPDRLHLTPAGHEEFGDFVAEQVASS